MISLPSSLKIYVARDPVDFRKAFDGLCAIIREEFGDDPFTGHLFVFFNKRRDRIKLIHWDNNGFWLLYKRLERGTFEHYSFGQGGCKRVEIDRATLQLILEGIDLRSPRFRESFARQIEIGRRPQRGHDGRHPRTRGPAR